MPTAKASQHQSGHLKAVSGAISRSEMEDLYLCGTPRTISKLGLMERKGEISAQ